MKLVKLYDSDDKFKSKKVLHDALNLSPQKAISISDMAGRCKLLRLLANAQGDLVLEDADHTVLKDVVEGYPWGVANQSLLDILLAVVDAPKAPAGMVPTPDEKEDA